MAINVFIVNFANRLNIINNKNNKTVTETKYIFVTGGVVSSLGKGIISSSIGKLLQARGYNITIQKFDPYINIDPGTLNPYEHGECYVTVDGMETDLDLGHYERFTGIQTTKANSLTARRSTSTTSRAPNTTPSQTFSHVGSCTRSCWAALSMIF